MAEFSHIFADFEKVCCFGRIVTFTGENCM